MLHTIPAKRLCVSADKMCLYNTSNMPNCLCCVACRCVQRKSLLTGRSARGRLTWPCGRRRPHQSRRAATASLRRRWLRVRRRAAAPRGPAPSARWPAPTAAPAAAAPLPTHAHARMSSLQTRAPPPLLTCTSHLSNSAVAPARHSNKAESLPSMIQAFFILSPLLCLLTMTMPRATSCSGSLCSFQQLLRQQDPPISCNMCWDLRACSGGHQEFGR